MIQYKKLFMTLALLLTAATGARADEVKYPIVYDFEAAANADENPANKNGSAANGQQFYGWENGDDKKDNARNDYKGYEYAEGSKLPEVCHVWRRSDRINGNVSGNGGLKCPNNKEMAVDGLTEGLTVTIVYDATNATDKEIVWAIGDGSSEGGPGSPRATATINGVDAVPGQTTIASGAVITVNSVTAAENGTGYIVFAVKKDMVIKKIIIDVAPTGTPVALTRGTGDKINEWTLTKKMPAGNVTVSVEYYPQAALTEAPTAINDVPATTDGAIVKAGTVATIGETTTAQGTVMYYVSSTALDDDALLALAADKWKADVPTAESLAEGQAYVYYYVRGNDSDTDEENFSDGDILAANALNVTIAAEPTYAVTFADGVNPEPPAEPEWTASPNADVKKGQTVTVTYTGTRKVIGVKAEKKAGDTGKSLAEATVGMIIGSNGKAYAADDKDNLPEGVTVAAKVCYVDGNGHGLAMALADEGQMNWSTAQTTCAAHTPAITGGTWKLATKDEWQQMINAAGGYDNLRNGFSSVGGTNLQTDGYWANTEYESNDQMAYIYYFSSKMLNQGWKTNSNLRVRACLAF